MSSRRVPLSSNPHAANSPLRGPSALSQFSKQKRSYANAQREEAYGQAPPIKKQALENGNGRPIRSPSKLPRAQNLIQRTSQPQTSVAVRPPIKERTTSKLATATRPVQDEEHKEIWKKHYRAKFPKMVFYFENIPDDVRAKLTKRIGILGARQEPFFSNDVTHVITTRPIPSERSENQQPVEQQEPEPQPEPEPEEQPQTINPSLLDRNTAARRKLLFEFRNVPSRSQQAFDPTKPNRGTRNNDVLHKAMEMDKKIWSLEKFSTMVSVLLENEMQGHTQTARSTTSRGPHGTAKQPQDSNLLQLLHNERVNGPSDRDLATSNKELVYFKGPFVYIYDMDEKNKPIMVREYNKVTNKADGEWPQFRSVGNGRCPFVEEVDYTPKEERKPREQEQPKVISKRQEGTATLNAAPTAPPPKPVTGKRTLTEMEDGQNKGGKLRAVLNPARAALSKQAFLSRAPSGRLHQGEPVASGLQASNVTSAIRSQMISSTTGLSGVKAGTSKEIHGLQRQVLQKAAPGSHGTSSRLAEQSAEGTSSRSISISRQTSKVAGGRDESSQKLDIVRSQSQPLKSKKDLKPGYCENCQDKFRDFDEHVLTRKHRRFAENNENWADLDALLSELSRLPKDTCWTKMIVYINDAGLGDVCDGALSCPSRPTMKPPRDT